jgi:peptide-methionine (S)-S-oxide reductase
MRLQGAIGTALVVLPVLAALSLMTARSENATRIDPPALDPEPASGGLQTAVLAGGCFWGVQAVYQHTKGVANAVSGYAGGSKTDADYITVGSGRTGHAEAVAVTFDPRVVSFGKILQIFFSVAHDPTQFNRQGPDYGPQYRSEIFPQSAAQRDVAKAYIVQLDAAHAYPKKIVTKFDTDKMAFYPAEDYHQDYATKHPTHPYIVFNDLPKVENLKTMFPEVWRETPVTVAQAGTVQN